MRRAILSCAVSVLAASTMAACGSTTPSAARSPASSGPARFPLAVSAANGRVVIPSRPKRIMSLSATATQMLYAVGAGPQVVAVDKYSTDPPNAPRTNLTGFEAGPESYVAYHPDLVLLAQDESGTVVAQLGALRIPTLLLPPASTLRDTYDQLAEIGMATGHVQAAASEATSIKQRLDAVTAAVGGRTKGRTYYHEVDPTLYTATSHTFIGALYGRLGMVNVADRAGRGGNDYPQLSPEYLISADPDYVFLADDVCCGQSAASFSQRPGFALLRAVKAGHVFVIPDPLASQWGPRVVQFLQTIVRDVEQPSKPSSGSKP